jgi:RNA polymerase sigma-70 factor (ECF subfamily)
MVTIAWRLALSRRRSLFHRLKQAAVPGDSAGDLASGQPSAETCVLDGERLAVVRQHISRLPPKLRDALLLTAAGDLTQDQIAAALKIPPATFRWRVMEARKRLRALI